MGKKKEDNKMESKNVSCLQKWAWVAEIITSVALAFFAGLEFYDAYNKHIEEKQLHQPIFQVQSLIDKSEGSQIYDLRNLQIYNVGETAKDISDIKINTYMQFAYTPNSVKKGYDTCYIPIWCYYGIKYQTYNLTGLVAYTQVDYPNNAHIARLSNEGVHSTRYPEYADVQMVTIVHISYTDKLNTQHRISFLNGDQDKGAQVARVEKESKERFDYKQWEIQDLDFNKMKAIWGGKVTEE